MDKSLSPNIVRMDSSSADSASTLLIVAILLSNSLLPQYSSTLIAALYILFYMITSHFTIPRSIAKYFSIPAALFLVGISGSFGNELYDILKDGWYFASPFVILAAGYLAMQRIQHLEIIIKYYYLCGAILSILHIGQFFDNPMQIIDAPFEVIRNEAGGGSFLVALSLSLLLMSQRYKVGLLHSRQKLFFLFMLIVNAISLILSFSRSLWLSFIIIIITMFGFESQKKIRCMVGATLSIIGVLIFIHFISVPFSHDRTTMIGKSLTTIDELLIKDYFIMSDLHSNWRSYESFRAWKTYIDGNFVNIIIGHGFGKLIDLKITMYLGNELFRYIPILHNGYFYLLVKTGVVGLILFLLYFIGIMRAGMYCVVDASSNVAFAGRLIIAFTLVILFTTFAISGIFNKSLLVPVLLLMGALLAYIKIQNAPGPRRSALL